MTRRETRTRQAPMAAAAHVGKQHAKPLGLDWRTVMLRVAGAGLLIATAAIHLDLYLTGYRTIPTIGWLFLLQVIAAFGLGLAVLVIPRRLVTLSRLAAAAGAGFALATLGGYLLSVWTGLFGFKEVRTGAGRSAPSRAARPAPLVVVSLVVLCRSVICRSSACAWCGPVSSLRRRSPMRSCRRGRCRRWLFRARPLRVRSGRCPWPARGRYRRRRRTADARRRWPGPNRRSA